MALELTELPVLTTELSMKFPKFFSLCKVLSLNFPTFKVVPVVVA